MMMMTIKKYKLFIGILLLPVLVLLLMIRSGEMGSSGDRQLELQTFQLEDGWGYQIVLNKKVLIYQPTVPAIDTVMAFPNKESATIIGKLVLYRLSNNENFSVSIEEVKHSLSH